MKNWLNMLVNIMGLTLGLAGLIFVLLYMNDEENYNKWNPNKDTVYRISNRIQNGDVWYVATTAQHEYFLSDLPEVTETMMVTPFYRERLTTANSKTQFEKKILYVENNFFDFFPFQPVQGEYEKFKESKMNIAIVEKVAEQFFGDLNPIGQIIDIEGVEFIVSMVFKKPPNSHYSPNFIVQFKNKIEPNWGNFNKELFCKVLPQTDRNLLKSKMDSVMLSRSFIPSAESIGITIEEYINIHGIQTAEPELLADIRLHHIAEEGSPEGVGNYELLLVLLGLSVLLILISAVNFINLSTASASQRAKEVGVKKTLGLSKSQLTIQYLLEIVLQGIIAFILALILVELLLPYLNEFIDKDLVIANLEILYTVGVITIFITLLVGIIPAIYLSNFKAIEVLKGNFSRSKRGVIVRNGMLGLQFLISGFFLIAVLVIYSQVHFMMTEDAGFNKEQVLLVSLNNGDNSYKNYKLAQKVFSQSSHIEDVSGSLFVPGHGFTSGTNFTYKETSFNAATNVVDFGYLDFAEIKIVKGRAFSRQFSADTNRSIMINETIAKLAGISDDPIGKEIDLGWDTGKGMKVIGVFQDYHVNGFEQEVYPMFMVTWDSFEWVQDWIGTVQFKVKPGHMQEAIAEEETFWTEELEPGYPFTYSFLDDDFAKTYESYAQQQTLFTILSIVVILTSLLGLFALSTLSIQQRFKEVAIRKTLGASVQEIVFQLIKGFLLIAVVSLLILLPLSYFVMENWLSNFVFRIDMPVWPYILAPLTLLILVVLVVGIKALNATKVDLIKYLKFE